MTPPCDAAAAATAQVAVRPRVRPGDVEGRGGIGTRGRRGERQRDVRSGANLGVRIHVHARAPALASSRNPPPAPPRLLRSSPDPASDPLPTFSPSPWQRVAPQCFRSFESKTSSSPDPASDPIPLPLAARRIATVPASRSQPVSSFESETRARSARIGCGRAQPGAAGRPPRLHIGAICLAMPLHYCTRSLRREPAPAGLPPPVYMI